VRGVERREGKKKKKRKKYGEKKKKKKNDRKKKHKKPSRPERPTSVFHSIIRPSEATALILPSALFLYTHCESSTVISLSVPYPALTKPFTKEDACVGKKKEERKKRENEIQQK
jgi:hypothetical protein